MSSQSNRFTCLLIEDEVLAIEMMVDYISRRGDLELLAVGTQLAEVRDILEKHRPAIIFLDLVIPPGESGSYHLGKLPVTSSIVVVSGIPLSHYKGVLPKGDIYELPKPVSFANFDKCVDYVINKGKEYRYGVEI